MYIRSFTYETITDAFYTLRDEFTQVITNVLYTNGNIDPMRYFGRLYDRTNAGIVINIDCKFMCYYALMIV